MIQKVFFRKINNLNANVFAIEFSKDINIIVGPKGGGKSTLFDLLATISKGYISKNVVDALKEFNLEFVKAENFGGEEVFANQLLIKTDKEKTTDFINRNNVIFQDDPIKKNINSSKTIDSQKKEHAIAVIEENIDNFSSLIRNIQSFHSQIKNIYESRNKNINWSNTFKFKKSNDEINILSVANYNGIKLINELSEQINNIDSLIKNINKNINSFKDQLINFDFNKPYYDDDFANKVKKSFEELIAKNNVLIKLFIEQKNKIIITKNIVNCFDKAFAKKITEIKEKDYENQGLIQFEKESRDFFKDFAIDIFNLQQSFKYLLSQDIVINIIDNSKINNMLSYRINDEFVINEDLMIDILKEILYKPSSINDVSKWIKTAQEKGVKEFELNKIKKIIVNKLKDNVVVYANGMVYDNMSLGQKSIYGIKYKYINADEDTLFLDQPEDNLDNNTIATSILDMIKDKKCQTFIVTHNANIGILTNPSKVIVADLNSDVKYYEGQIVSNDLENIDASTYLEGGVSYLEKRYKIIKGIKNEN